MLERVLRRVVGLRYPIIAAYALLVPLAAILATRIPSQGTIDRLLVSSDPDVVATRAFQRIFPEGNQVLLLAEAGDPWRPEVLADVSGLEDALRHIPGVGAYSVLDVFRRAHPGFSVTPAGAAELRRFATGTSFFRRQGLIGDRFLGIAVSFPAEGGHARDRTLAAMDAAVARSPLAQSGVRKVGAPYVESWIERESSRAALRTMPLFGVLVVAIALFLYRSARSLLAILLTLASAVALGVGAGRPLGFSFTVVSSLVPLTIMVTALATLVYLHSRFVDQAEGVPLDQHQILALANKFLPVTASSAAAVLGFAALSVSRIRPIREMGIWTATGLALTWIVAFTLFPALQKTLRTPTGRLVPVRSRVYDQIAAALPGFTWRARWLLLATALLLAAAGGVALFGIPGRLAPMRVGLDSLDYVDPHSAIYRDLTFYRRHVAELNVARVWVRTPPDTVTDPEVLRGLDLFMTAAERIPGVYSAVGPTTFLRLRRYLAGQGDSLPQDPRAFAAATADLEQLLLTEPELRGFIDVRSLSNAQITLTFEHGGEAGYQELTRALRSAWNATVAADPALRGSGIRVVGESLVQAKVGASLIPTLSESFGITAALIFLAFLLVFRSPTARLMAMIPSLFAILATFLGMRLAGASLNVATILIATTVLGTTENDQIHFFHHLQEGEGPAGLDGALRHTLRVSGRAIVFATLINAAGFLGLATSAFPPLRQFGVVTACAFLLAMIADFSALPAALWIVRRERPGQRAQAGPPAAERATRR